MFPKLQRNSTNPIFPPAPFDLHPEYDFIVVGSGPAGCVLANRLTENPGVSVLLLEAGSRQDTIHTVPSLANHAARPKDRWSFTINPYSGSCLGALNQQCVYPLGRILGGSSAFNYMIYLRGSRNDYDKWSQMGNYGWSYADLVPLFERIENTTLLANRAAGLRGIDGPLSIANPSYRTKIAENFIEASMENGLIFRDLNGEESIGVDYTQGTTKNGRRHSAVDAYLTPIKKQGRRNLHVMLNSLVSKVIIDPLTRTALGVEFNHRGRTYRVSARKEVILSAGPIMSPQLLMLSGIGPREDLEKFGIPVIQDLPVGRQYMDHTVSGGYIFTVNTTGENIDLRDIEEKDVRLFGHQGRGKLTVPSITEAIAMIRFGLRPNVPVDNPEMEVLMAPSKDALGTEGHTPMRGDLFEAMYKPLVDSSVEVYSMSLVDLYSEARGRVRLRGGSINNPPIIEFPFFENPRDLEVHVRGIREVIALSETRAMQRIGAKFYNVPIPDCAALGFGTDEYWRCHVRHFSRNVCHAAATNKMGPKGDPEAVVDPELRVFGVDRLRVADSSVAPTQVAGHTQGVAYVVGEKMAGLLKENWGI